VRPQLEVGPQFTTTVEVECAGCLRTKTIPPSKRNDPRWPGEHCDGASGARHPILLMRGPEGEKNR
jgi:hypothetical protein